MWTTLFKIKKTFSKIYRNTKQVYESIYYDTGSLISPIVMVGSNGIGGGNFGSYIDITSKITNNTILDIQSNSKDEEFITNFSYAITEQNMGTSYKEVILYGCNYLVIDLYYFYVMGGVLPVPPSYGGVYYILFVDGVAYYDSKYTTTSLSILGTGSHVYASDGVKTVWAGNYPVPPGGSHSALTTHLCRDYTFNTPKTIKVVFYFSFPGYNTYMAHPIEGNIHVTSLKASSDITRDIYATVIEQVEPVIN